MYIPVTVDIYADIVVANRNLHKGDILRASDIEFHRVNTSTAGRGYIDDIARVEGMELKKPIKEGQLVKMSHIKKPDIILKGQSVTVSSSTMFLTVESPGIALHNGQLGEQIKVKNERSNRVVSAHVIAPGKVEVASR